MRNEKSEEKYLDSKVILRTILKPLSQVKLTCLPFTWYLRVFRKTGVFYEYAEVVMIFFVMNEHTKIQNTNIIEKQKKQV